MYSDNNTAVTVEVKEYLNMLQHTTKLTLSNFKRKYQSIKRFAYKKIGCHDDIRVSAEVEKCVWVSSWNVDWIEIACMDASDIKADDPIFSNFQETHTNIEMMPREYRRTHYVSIDCGKYCWYLVNSNSSMCVASQTNNIGDATMIICGRWQNFVFSMWQLYRFAIFPLLNTNKKAYFFVADDIAVVCMQYS